MPLLFAVDDAYLFPYGGELHVPASGVKTNDYWDDGSGPEPLPTLVGVSVFEDVASGILEMNFDGSFNYFPDPGVESDQFRYMLYEPSGTPLGSTIATVTLVATGVPPPPTPTPATGSLALFVRGHDASAGGLSLYLRGIDAPAPKTTTLFTSGADAPAPGSFTLFVEGDYGRASGALPLYTRSVGSGQAGLALFTRSATEADRGPLPLYLYAGDIPPASGGVTLFTHGADASGVCGGFTLFVEAASGDNEVARSLPLFLAGATDGSAVGNMNLWVEGGAHEARGSLDLFLLNAQSGVAGSFTMYVSGDGEAAGWNPSAKSLNLVLARDPANALPLYVRGPGTTLGSGLALAITGSEASADALPLAMPEVVGHGAKSVRLFIRGY